MMKGMIKELFSRLLQKLLGHELAVALLILLLILKTLRHAHLENTSKRVYQQIPPTWRNINGLDNMNKEPQWFEAISAGERFLRAVSRITT